MRRYIAKPFAWCKRQRHCIVTVTIDSKAVAETRIACWEDNHSLHANDAETGNNSLNISSPSNVYSAETLYQWFWASCAKMMGQNNVYSQKDIPSSWIRSYFYRMFLHYHPFNFPWESFSSHWTMRHILFAIGKRHSTLRTVLELGTGNVGNYLGASGKVSRDQKTEETILKSTCSILLLTNRALNCSVVRKLMSNSIRNSAFWISFSI